MLLSMVDLNFKSAVVKVDSALYIYGNRNAGNF